MRTSDALRQKRCRGRRRKGLVPVQVLVSRQEVDFLMKRAYELTPGDKASIGHAVEPFLSDAPLRQHDECFSGRVSSGCSECKPSINFADVGLWLAVRDPRPIDSLLPTLRSKQLSPWSQAIDLSSAGQSCAQRLRYRPDADKPRGSPSPDN
jgi:hypothetical protein